jgi:hypothetical protein
MIRTDRDRGAARSAFELGDQMKQIAARVEEKA